MAKHQVKYEHLWEQLAQKEALSPEQLAAFKQYGELLLTKNENVNLTAITNMPGVIRHHFMDSLSLGHHYDMSKVTVMADVGTGAGFPALPLKIKYPHLKILLIDMNKKRQAFLRQVCTALGLEDVQIAEYDWRTFVRITQGEVDLFTARASLSVKELARMFKQASAYKEADLVYWASEKWEPEEKERAFIKEQWSYKIGSRTRQLVLLGKSA